MEKKYLEHTEAMVKILAFMEMGGKSYKPGTLIFFPRKLGTVFSV